MVLNSLSNFRTYVLHLRYQFMTELEDDICGVPPDDNLLIEIERFIRYTLNNFDIVDIQVDYEDILVKIALDERSFEIFGKQNISRLDLLKYFDNYYNNAQLWNIGQLPFIHYD